MWQCSNFQKEDVNCWWEIVKKLKLCLQCLGSHHLSKSYKVIEYVGLIVVQTCIIAFYIKNPEKVEEWNPQESDKKQKGNCSFHLKKVAKLLLMLYWMMGVQRPVTHSGRLGDWYNSLRTQTMTPKNQFSSFLSSLVFQQKNNMLK